MQASSQVRSRLQLYLAVVGVIGIVPCVVEATDGSGIARILPAIGLGLCLSYIGCAVALERAIRRRWVVRITATFLVWSLAVLVSLFLSTGSSRQLVIPWVLFVLLPSVSALWMAQDLCSARH